VVQRFDAALRGAPYGVTRLDPAGRVVAVNETMLSWLDRPRAKVKGRALDAFLDARSAASFAKALGVVARGGTVTEVAVSLRRDDGKTFPVRMAGMPIAGGPRGTSLWTAMDTLRRRRAEEERDRFFRLSPDLLCIAGFDGRFRRVNPAWERVLGWTEEELTSRPWLDFVHPDDVPATVEAARRQTEEGRDVLHFENRYKTKDGRWRVFQWMSVPNAESGRIYAAARDVTEEREAGQRIAALARDLERKNAEALAANQELESFSYAVSHDLRAPLRAIDGFSLAILEDCGEKLDERGRDSLARVRAATVRMAALIDDLLRLSRVTRGRLERKVVDVSALAQGVVDDLRAGWPDRVVDVAIEPGIAVEGDRDLLRVLLANLLGNAWKYTSKKPRARIDVGATRRDGRTTIFVKDDGAGFDMQYAHKLFGVFQRLHLETDFPGTGIGLATVHRIATRHGGRVWAEGEVGRGATFFVEL
jgi:PAS domain S-box-containing protein